jgi:hypothetical protein
MKVTPRFFRLSTLASGTALVSVAALMAACGGGDDLGPATTGVLSGTAATGAPITGGRVDVACASGSPLSATTSATGTYEVALQGQALPCKLKVSGGSLASGVAYHSVALQAGTVNLTPLTDLVVARMAGGAPSAWFSAIAAADFQKLTADAVNTALGAITTGLGLATPLGGKNPMTAGFEAKTTDPLDKVLEAIKAAAPSHATLLTAAQGTNWNTLAQTYVAAINAALAGAASGGTTNPVSGGGTGSVPTVSLGACAANPTPGTYSMVVETTVSGLGSVPVPTVCINNIASAPASESAFCGDATIKQQLPAGITLESCKYDAATAKGTIAAKITTPVAIGYTVTYTFVKR